MSETMLLSVAVVVFMMLAIGLGLTILEFRHGQPREDAVASGSDQEQPPGPAS